MSYVVLQITKCPICGTSYHWPSIGKGNCPTCAARAIADLTNDSDDGKYEGDWNEERGKYR